MSIRDANAKDFSAIRKLPVQLASTAASTLTGKQYRELLLDPGAVLLVEDTEKKVSAFIALNFSPAVDSPIRFLVIMVFAIDHFSMRLGIASAMTEEAVKIAREGHSAALLINAGKLRPDMLGFYERLGFAGSPDCMIKKLDYQQ